MGLLSERSMKVKDYSSNEHMQFLITLFERVIRPLFVLDLKEISYRLQNWKNLTKIKVVRMRQSIRFMQICKRVADCLSYSKVVMQKVLKFTPWSKL